MDLEFKSHKPQSGFFAQRNVTVAGDRFVPGALVSWRPKAEDIAVRLGMVVAVHPSGQIDVLWQAWQKKVGFVVSTELKLEYVNVGEPQRSDDREGLQR